MENAFPCRGAAYAGDPGNAIGRQWGDVSLDELEELAKMVQSMALCGLGKSAPLPVLSTASVSREYEEVCPGQEVPGKVCTALRQFPTIGILYRLRKMCQELSCRGNFRQD